MTRFLGFAIAAILAYPMPALADNWVNVAVGENGTNYVDTDSIDRSGDIAWYWTYTLFPEPDEAGVASFAAFESTDCNRRVVRLRQIIEYDRNRKVMFSSKPGNDGPLVNINPGTPGEAIFRFVCAQKLSH